MGMLDEIKNTMGSPENLDDVLLDMSRYGQPKLSMHDNGWYCWIKMYDDEKPLQDNYCINR